MNAILVRLRRHWIRIALGLAVLVAFLLHVREEEGGLFRVGLIDQLENLAYDTRLAFSMPRTLDPRIVIVDIDEKSLAAEGRWPWPRHRLAKLLEQLFGTYRVALVGFDIVFAEPDESSGLKVLERLAAGELKAVPRFDEALEQLRPQLDNDAIFAGALGEYPVVLGYFFNEQAKARTGALPAPTFIKGSFPGKRIAFRDAAGYGANLALFNEAALGAGHFNPWLDVDGVVRRVPMVFSFEGAQYEALSLAVARHYLQVKDVRAEFEPVPSLAAKSYSGLEWLRIGKARIPVDEHVQALVPYRGHQGSFPYVSATDVINGKADPKLLKEGAIALVGTTSAGLLDLRATPVQRAYPGVEIHANLIAGILDGRIMQQPAYTRGAEFVLLAIFGLVFALTLPMLSPLAATLAALGMLGGYIGVNLAFWHFGTLVLPIASGVLMMLVMFLLNMSYGYFIETRGKRQLTGLFGQYVPPELVDEMAKDPEQYSLEAESREMTVLFSDVRGFTSISEGLEPKEVAELMNQMLTPMTTVIHDHRGTIDKYMGDAIMAFWGAPVPDLEHARHAITAAMEMMAKLEEMNAQFKERGWPEIRVGIGINTGVMNVGNMGSEFRMAYTVLGDSVNLGSRLEGLTKGYGVHIIVSEASKDAVPDYAYRELDVVRVKGKDKPVGIYEPIAPATAVDKRLQDELKLYRQALRYYRTQQWDMAELQFLNLAKAANSGYLYKMYAERVAYFRRNPPGKDWDGVFTFTTK
ncbi:MAG: CHASE2 domain-containing protein [Chromatiales bacterium]